jgi:hypothetical protein
MTTLRKRDAGSQRGGIQHHAQPATGQQALAGMQRKAVHGGDVIAGQTQACTSNGVSAHPAAGNASGFRARWPDNRPRPGGIASQQRTMHRHGLGGIFDGIGHAQPPGRSGLSASRWLPVWHRISSASQRSTLSSRHMLP